MKIFVTGATGVVGRRLIPLLLSAGHEVTAIARSSAAGANLNRQGATPVNADLFEPQSVRKAIRGHNAVINLATHVPHSMAQVCLPWAWRENDRLRRVVSTVLTEACTAENVPRFIQESFAPVYPDRGNRWIDESVALSPVRFNRTILDAETAIGRFSRSGRIGVVLRFGAFYGADAFQTIDLIKWIRRGWVPLPGSANAYISSVSHDDAATATAAAIELPPGAYNVVDDEPVTHRVFVESLAEVLDVQAPRLPSAWSVSLFGALGRLMSRSVRISNRKLRSTCAWMPKYSSVRQGWRAIVPTVREDLGGQAFRA